MFEKHFKTDLKAFLMINISILLGAFMALAAAGEAQENPLGDDFQVNTFTTSYQIAPALGLEPAGGLIVVWHSDGSSGDDAEGFSIQGQRYASDGSVLGAEFQINSYSSSDQSYPAIAVAPDGGFMVVWQSDGSADADSSGTSIQGQRFASDGSPIGGEFQVNTDTSFDQTAPQISADAAGNTVVVWQSGGGIQGQRFLPDGAMSGGQFQGHGADGGSRPDVAMDPEGHFVIVWEAYDSEHTRIVGQLFSADAMPVVEFGVSDFALGTFASMPKVIKGPDGGFVVVWHQNSNDVSTFSVRGRVFASNGLDLSTELQINELTTGDQFLPDVALGPGGAFTVVWASDVSAGNDDDANSIQGRRFNAEGQPRGGDFQVNSYTPSYQLFPTLAADSAGDFTVAWHSFESGGDDSDGFSVQGRRFAPSLFGLLFQDGFESGNTESWSLTVP